MRKYSGPLGRFSYDETQYKLGVDEDGKSWLGYIGTETDGRLIQVPYGIVDGTGMFQDTAITSQPELPDSLKIADCMFAGCDGLRHGGTIPPGVVSADYMYSCCPGLESVEELPEGLKSAQGMFDGCTVLRDPPEIPRTLENADYMFDGCANLSSMPDIPASLMERSESLKAWKDDMRTRENMTFMDVQADTNGTKLGSLFSSAEAEARTESPAFAVRESAHAGPIDREGLLHTLDISGMEDDGQQDDLSVDI